MFTVAVNPTVVHAAKSPVTKVAGQPIKNGIHYGDKSGDTVITPYWGNFYYRTTVSKYIFRIYRDQNRQEMEKGRNYQ